MEELKLLLKELVGEELCRIILSNPVDRERGSKVTARPVMLKGELSFQETLYKENKVYHRNCTAEELSNRILSYMQTDFRQAEIETKTYKVTALVSKKGKVTIKKKRLTERENSVGTENLQKDRQALLSHNRAKNYILEEGKPVDFLVGLGVQTPDGRIVKAKYDKFRQINRYLEFIEDIVKKLPSDRPVRIIDFGCGKSYLTFAMYYYLHVLKQYEVRVTGLDLKEDVIDFCNELSEKYHYEHLHFEKGDISTYEGTDTVDMVVTLHACDTATDYALEKAVKWGGWGNHGSALLPA